MVRPDSNRSRIYIMNDYRRIVEDTKNKEYSIGLIDDNIYNWEVVIFGPQDTPYEFGMYRAEMTFPTDYPESPPKFRFTTQMYHPNIFKNGDVCISILHKAGSDIYGYEAMGERWLPVRTPESIILSITSMLDNPNFESPANCEAGLLYRRDIEEYKKKIRRLAQKSLEE